jgi:hypothetical protein
MLNQQSVNSAMKNHRVVSRERWWRTYTEVVVVMVMVVDRAGRR